MLHYASLGSDDIELSPVLGVFQSDAILTPELVAKVQQALEPLENVPDEQKDWHPGSDEQVLDIVHPSLYPLVYGATRRVAQPIPPGVATWRSYLGCGDAVRPLPKTSGYPNHTITYDGLHLTAPDGSSLDGKARTMAKEDWQSHRDELESADASGQVCRKCVRVQRCACPCLCARCPICSP